MTAQFTEKNGHRPMAWTQAAVGTHRATPGFGGQNVAMTAAASHCHIDVIETFLPMVLADLQRSGQPTEPVTTDELDVPRLTEAVLAGASPLWQAEATIAASERVLAIVESAKQRQPLETTAQIQDAVTCVAERALDEVVTKLHRLADSPPASLRTMGFELLKVLARLKPAVRDAAGAIQQAAEAVERAKTVTTREASFAPADWPFVVGQLHDWARRSVRTSFRAFVEELIGRELVSKWPMLTDAAQALVNLSGEALGRIDELKRVGIEWVHAERLTVSQPLCATILTLAATQAEEAVAGLLERHRFTGRSELVRYLADRWLATLREYLRDRVTFDPEAAGAFQVLAAVSPITAFSEFKQLLQRELQPEVLTVYGRLRQTGVPETLQRLLDRSALTSDPGPRASPRFKLNAYRICIVSLPQVSRPADLSIRQELLRWLEDGGQIEVVEHAAAFDEIIVHQIGGGWPWQILPSNRHLRDQYLTAADAGHHAHLVNVFPQSPAGKIVSVYRTLQAHEEHSHGGQ